MQFSVIIVLVRPTNSSRKCSGNSGSKNEHKRMRIASNQDLENAVLKWFVQLCSSGVKIHGIDLQSSLKKIADQLVRSGKF